MYSDKWTIVTDAISCLDNSLCGVGGACASICGTNGYCCSGSPPIPGLNGDCPADAVAFLNAADSSQTIHQCIVQGNTTFFKNIKFKFQMRFLYINILFRYQ